MGKDWSKFIEPHNADLDALTDVLKDLGSLKINTSAFVNNHFEGCAPQTIERLKERMGQ